MTPADAEHLSSGKPYACCRTTAEELWHAYLAIRSRYVLRDKRFDHLLTDEDRALLQNCVEHFHQCLAHHGIRKTSALARHAWSIVTEMVWARLTR